MYKNVTTKNICELAVNNNIKVFKSRSILLLGIILSILSMLILYSQFNMNFTSYIILDYILNITILSVIYISITATLMQIYLNKIHKFINLNIEILLHKVNTDNLGEAYKESIKEKISDEDLLTFLQNFKSKKSN